MGNDGKGSRKIMEEGSEGKDRNVEKQYREER